MSTLQYRGSAHLAAAYTRAAFEAASDWMVANGYPPIVVVDGDRSYEWQVQVFLSRYVLAWQVGGRRVYDQRWWEGRLYSRISPAGTVAAPSRTAPHVAKRGADLGYPYNDRTTGAHRKLQAVAHLFDLEWTGRNFAEDWHWEKRGAVGPVGSTSGSNSKPLPVPPPPPKPLPIPEEDDMAIKFGHRNTGVDEWMIVHPDLNGGDEKQLGYLVTTDEDRARAWARLYKNGWEAKPTGAEGRYDFDVDRAGYIEIQEAARQVYAATHA